MCCEFQRLLFSLELELVVCVRMCREQQLWYVQRFAYKRVFWRNPFGSSMLNEHPAKKKMFLCCI